MVTFYLRAYSHYFYLSKSCTTSYKYSYINCNNSAIPNSYSIAFFSKKWADMTLTLRHSNRFFSDLYFWLDLETKIMNQVRSDLIKTLINPAKTTVWRYWKLKLRQCQNTDKIDGYMKYWMKMHSTLYYYVLLWNA